MEEKKFTFGDALDALRGVIGYKTPNTHFKGTFISEKLNIDPTLFATKRNGRSPVNESELSRIIDLYALGEHGLDFRIFRAETEDAFLKLLKDAGVGTYGQHVGKKFRQLLYNEGRENSQFKIRIFDVNEPTRRGGVGFGQNGKPSNFDLKIGSSVRVICEGRANSHVIILNERINHEITILSPSLYAPQTFTGEKAIIFPKDSEFEKFKVKGPSGDFRMYAIWTTADVVAVVKNKIDITTDYPALLLDDVLTPLHRIFESEESVFDAAFCEYTVYDI